MPPKKDTAPEPKPLIGRVGTNLKVGIVGLPNVGMFLFLFDTQLKVNLTGFIISSIKVNLPSSTS